MSMRLVVLKGPESGRVIELEAGKSLTVGRGAASDAKLNDPRVSRIHFKLQASADEVLLSDAGSTGGTVIDGKKVSTCFLTNGNEIRIGDTWLRFESNPIMPTLTDEVAGGKACPSAHSTMKQLVGKTFANFQLEQIAHVGSASLLFRAKDLKHDRKAMVKVMQPSLMLDDEQRQRFVRAVDTMINVQHANLVEVYGAGKQGSFCWCAMEYVDGISILEIIELIGVNGRLDWQDVYRVGVHVARALECAYRHKVIHRNVTPDNLIQRKNDKVVKLCDLMLAKALEGTQALQLTTPGQFIGNVSYMSPERMFDASNLDWRSDQYSLGATLYALLTGHPPFVADSLPELVIKTQRSAAAFPKVVQQDANQQFQQIILKMLGKNPEDRFTYPVQLLDCLEDLGKQTDVDADVMFNC